MRRLQIVVTSLVLCALGGSAWADTNSSLVLDYDAKAKGCPDAGRFADEVSSKLGFVPWNEQGLSEMRIRIRIRKEGSELVGTLELPDGSSKILRDSKCAPLFAALTTAASVALDSGSAAPVARQSGVGTTPDPAKATIHVTTDGEGLSVSIIKDRMVVVGSGGGSAVGISWEEVCVAPCSFEIEPGMHEIVISGQGPGASRKVAIVAGEDVYLAAEPGSPALYWGGYAAASVGVVAVLYGLATLGRKDYDSATGDEIPQSNTVPVALVVGGLAGMGLGIGMLHMSPSRLDEESGPQSSQVTARAVSYSGTF